MADLSVWAGAPEPQRVVLEGRYARLEPLDARHQADLYAMAVAPGADSRFRYLPEAPYSDASKFQAWMEKSITSKDPLFFAVIDKATGRAGGRQSLMRIVREHGVIEMGHVVWGPAIARTRIATEAQFLFAQYVFETLGYRRYEWKCNAENKPSWNAALRFGFHYEGTFRQHMVVKGLNRDTAWFSILDSEWPALKDAYLSWLAPENFDEAGQQKKSLAVRRS